MDQPAAHAASPFASFWMAGFECADHNNAFGIRVDLTAATRHVEHLDEDYRRLGQIRMRTVREGIRWSQVECTPYSYDWSLPARIADTAQAQGIQVLWDICHFGFPDDLTPLHPMFARRFAAICRDFVRFMRGRDASTPLIITPINEVSFLSWLGGDVRGTAPYCVGQGWEVKYRLMKAYIEGIEAMKEVDPGVRILTTEPLVHITHDLDARRGERLRAHRHHEDQFQVTDILSGRMCPELRGRPEYLDLMGLNYYYDNQWVKTTGEILVWTKHHLDARWKPLHLLLHQAYRRYGRPVVLSETSHPKEDRPMWAEMIGHECASTLAAGVPLLGVCWYPIVDRPDWDHLQLWHQSGLWERREPPTDNYERVLHEPTAKALLHAQDLVAAQLALRPQRMRRRRPALGAAVTG